LASAVDLARFAAAFDSPEQCPILSPPSVHRLWQRPDGEASFAGDQPKDVYYALGWQVREVGEGRTNQWHSGSLPGTATLLIRRHDGKNFVALLNSRVSPTTSHLGREIDQELHRAASQVSEWPNYDLFSP
jgi:N-acyl-D-amino-acid deacylase